ncbi:MAG: hypothetical protein J6X18_15450 [Bacteroidales bacterium]|nr:hypothetical protein [Bacteroidales bacterium]
MNKQDEEKAASIADSCIGERTRNHPANQLEKIIIRDACLEMVEWKDRQFNEDKKELLGLVKLLKVDETNQTIIEDLKAILQ